MKNWVIWILRLAVGLEFFGRAWQFLFLSTPIREFFWNYRLFGWFVESYTELTWSQYLVHPKTETYLNLLQFIIGLCFLVASASAFLGKKPKTLLPLLIGVMWLIPISWTQYFGVAYNWIMWLEYAGQVFTPLILFWVLVLNPKSSAVLTTACVIAGITFVCHGVYASGIRPIPEKFIGLTVGSLGVGRQNALVFLKIAGILDFICVLALFWKTSRKWGLIYMCFWGFVTAFARVIAHFYAFDLWNSLSQWSYEFFIRSPHFLLPIAILLTEQPIFLKSFRMRQRFGSPAF
ncbi:hypothetical protein [Luteibaculum oceani]|uniref:Uncharacterized protein n=1 Tax=Luteibaculum oceani TaxID=1294296 RepID=A0A5C6VK62_9FLAO|nr:hypothetical protein [Luteibaculum oceani]TXC85379.1 hypothetical protein FRX97_01775 [Luteibaculum oceani]